MNPKNIIFICVILCTTSTNFNTPDKKSSSPYIILYQTPQSMWQQHPKKTALGSLLSTLGIAFIARGHSSADIAQRTFHSNQFDQKTKNIDANCFNRMAKVGYTVAGVCLLSGLSVLLYTYLYTDIETNKPSDIISTTSENAPKNLSKSTTSEKLLKK